MSMNLRGAVATHQGSPPSSEAERYRLALEAIDDGVWDWDVEAGSIYCSPAYFGMLGYPAVAATRRYEDWLADVHPDDRAGAEEAVVACLEGRNESFGIEYSMRKADRSWLWVFDRGRGVARDEAGRCLRMIGTHVDISERKKHEATIAKLLEQKAFLHKELQHRVKNSLALLHSMLHLQGVRYPDGSEAHKALADAAHRVQGLAMLYNRLYAEGRSDVLESGAFLAELIRSLKAGADGAVRIEADLCSAGLGLDLLSPLGIMATELVTNAMKHAAAPDKPAAVRVRTMSQAGRFELLVSDDGPGLDRDAVATLRGKASERAGFGLFMVRALADQIGARVEAAAGSSEVRVSLAASAEAEAAEGRYSNPA